MTPDELKQLIEKIRVLQEREWWKNHEHNELSSVLLDARKACEILARLTPKIHDLQMALSEN